jgi:ADP-heptose:LPS heptosyltransferase
MKLIKLTEPLKRKSLHQVISDRHKVLIIRNQGGLGDIFMHRMIFEDIKILYPECHLAFACPKQFFEAVEDHPFLDDVVDCEKVDRNNYGVHYDTSNGCIRFELKNSPYSDQHRSDIWADVCGLKLTKHDMHFVIDENVKNKVKENLKLLNPENKPIFIISPLTAMENKNLYPEQINPILKYLKDLFVIISHKEVKENYDAPFYISKSIKELMAFISLADYVLSADTSVFHLAGGLDKKTTAVFSWADGLVYGKYHKHLSLVQKHRNNGDWDCGPCYNFPLCEKCAPEVTRKPCMTEINSEMILNGVLKSLN